MSGRTLNGNSFSNTSNIYINNMFEDGEAIEIIQESETVKAQVNLSMKKNTAETTTLNTNDWFLIADNATGRVVKRIQAEKLKNEATHWTLSTDGSNLHPDNTGYNLVLGAEGQGADSATWRKFKCDGEAYITGKLTLDSTINDLTLPTGTRTLATLDKAEVFTNKTLTLPKISENSGTETYEIAGGSISANRKITLPDLLADDIMVCADFIQTLKNKTLDNSNTLTSSTLTTPKITGGSYKYTLTGASLADNRILNLPAITTTDTVVVSSLAQNVSNKTFSSCVYTSPTFNEIVLEDASGGSDTTITIRALESVNPEILNIPAMDTTASIVITEAQNAQTLVNIILTAPTINNPVLKLPKIYDSDFTHIYQIKGENLTADRDITLPAVADNTEVFITDKHAQTLTNKTIVSPYLTTPKINDLNATHEYRITAPFDLADHRICNLPQLTATNDFVFNIHPQTLTNKTLTSPIIAEFKNSSSSNPLLVPQPSSASSNNTIATIGNLKLDNAFGASTVGTLTLGNVGLSSLTYNSKTHIIECAGSDASSMNSVLQINGSKWVWTGDSSGSGVESTYENIIQVLNPALKAYDSTTIGYPQLKLKLNNSFGENLFLTSHDPDETCFWSALIMGSSSSGNPFYFTQGIAKNRASSNSWGIFMGGSGGDLHFEYQPASGALTLKGWVGITPTSGSSKQMNFTGEHRCITENQDIMNNIDNYIGLVVYSTGEYNSILVNDNEDDPADTGVSINEAQPIVALTKKAKEKRVLGVIAGVETAGEIRDWGNGVFMSQINKKIINPRVHINALGEGGIKVCNQQGDIKNGDLLTTSSKTGLAMKQMDDLIHSYTIGKSTQDYTFTSDTDYKLIGCCYYCG